MKLFPASLAVLLTTALMGCMLFTGPEERALRKNPSFREGYEDGCAAAGGGANPREQPYRDDALYNSDAAYRSGWNDGHSVCRSQTNTPALPGGNPALSGVPGTD
jgi:hypothetical protein